MQSSAFLTWFLWSYFCVVYVYGASCSRCTTKVYLSEENTLMEEPEVSCLPDPVQFDELNGACYSTYEFSDCMGKCEHDAYSSLHISSNNDKGHENVMQLSPSQVGWVDISSSSRGFSITFKCYSDTCPVPKAVKETQLLIKQGTYAQYLEKERLLQQITELVNRTPAAASVKSKVPAEDESRNHGEDKKTATTESQGLSMETVIFIVVGIVLIFAICALQASLARGGNSIDTEEKKPTVKKKGPRANDGGKRISIEEKRKQLAEQVFMDKVNRDHFRFISPFVGMDPKSFDEFLTRVMEPTDGKITEIVQVSAAEDPAKKCTNSVVFIDDRGQLVCSRRKKRNRTEGSVHNNPE